MREFDHGKRTPFGANIAGSADGAEGTEEATEEDIECYTAELQASLDRVCEFAEVNVKHTGTVEFPYYTRG